MHYNFCRVHQTLRVTPDTPERLFFFLQYERGMPHKDAKRELIEPHTNDKRYVRRTKAGNLPIPRIGGVRPKR
jgi:hypothetical protein